MPFIIAATVTAAKSAAAAEGAQKLKDGIAGLFGDTATDRAREARIDALYDRAIAGDTAAVVALCYEAFEPRLGQQGDPRTPVDGKRSPESVRSDAVKALRAYVARNGALPQVAARWAAALGNAPVLSGTKPLEGLLDQIVDPITDAAIDRGAERAADVLNPYKPYLIAGGILVAVAILVTLTRAKS